MKFGGTSEFGVDRFGGDAFALSPQYIVDCMLTVLRHFERSESGGCLQRVELLTVALNDEAAMTALCAAGTPAIYVGYTGAQYQAVDTTGRQLERVMSFGALCIASDLHGRTTRLSGKDRYEPGLWNLLSWAAIYGGRALAALRTAVGRPVTESMGTFGPGIFIGQIIYEVRCGVDVLEDIDSAAVALAELGIVHNPVDLAHLFADDNVAPNTNDPTSPAVGIATL